MSFTNEFQPQSVVMNGNSRREPAACAAARCTCALFELLFFLTKTVYHGVIFSVCADFVLCDRSSLKEGRSHPCESSAWRGNSALIACTYREVGGTNPGEARSAAIDVIVQAYWIFGGTAVMTRNFVRLTPAAADSRGFLWNDYELVSRY